MGALPLYRTQARVRGRAARGHRAGGIRRSRSPTSTPCAARSSRSSCRGGSATWRSARRCPAAASPESCSRSRPSWRSSSRCSRTTGRSSRSPGRAAVPRDGPFIERDLGLLRVPPAVRAVDVRVGRRARSRPVAAGGRVPLRDHAEPPVGRTAGSTSPRTCAGIFAALAALALLLVVVELPDRQPVDPRERQRCRSARSARSTPGSRSRCSPAVASAHWSRRRSCSGRAGTDTAAITLGIVARC